jgi:hypothetical protein
MLLFYYINLVKLEMFKKIKTTYNLMRGREYIIYWLDLGLIPPTKIGPQKVKEKKGKKYHFGPCRLGNYMGHLSNWALN